MFTGYEIGYYQNISSIEHMFICQNGATGVDGQTVNALKVKSIENVIVYQPTNVNILIVQVTAKNTWIAAAVSVPI